MSTINSLRQPVCRSPLQPVLLYSHLLALAVALGCGSASSIVSAADFPQWRGPERNGLSQEKGLLKQWPEGGPKLLWQAKEIGAGYSTPAVVGDKLYLLASQGLENEFVEALDAKDGHKLWSTRLGNVGNPKQQPNFPTARSTPTVEGKVLYALGSDGDLACLDRASGKLVWQKSLRNDFGGKPGIWAYAESPLVDGDKLICTPGGADATLVALNTQTGETIWKCALPEGDEAAYSSVIIAQAGGVKEYVQFLEKGVVGIAASDGKLLWRYTKTVGGYKANIPTPVADGDWVYSGAAGTGGGLIKLKPAAGKIEVEQIYFSPKLPTAIGGAVKIGDNLYGTTSQALMCVDFLTGAIKWEDRAIGAASLCYADGRLYLHGENGVVELVDPSSAAFQEKGRFTPPNPPARLTQMEKAWAYPVVANGRLFIRDQNSLWCYEVKAGES